MNLDNQPFHNYGLGLIKFNKGHALKWYKKIFELRAYIYYFIAVLLLAGGALFHWYNDPYIGNLDLAGALVLFVFARELKTKTS